MKYFKEKIVTHCSEGQDGAQSPEMTLYLLDTSEEITMIRKRPMILVCPGGAYAYRSRREAEPIVMAFLSAGFHCALVEYSTAPAKWPCAARELARAVATVRENADAWNVRKDRILVCGFSAGGHLAATLGTIWNDPLFEEEFGCAGCTKEEKIWKPDAMILSYPVITMGEFAHTGSRENLLGAGAPEELWQTASLETRVTKDTVPAFLWHTAADESVPVENTLQFAAALRREKIPFEMHVFENGGHGLSLCNELTATKEAQIVPEDTAWIELAVRWVKGIR